MKLLFNDSALRHRISNIMPEDRLQKEKELHLLITDSGLGGLSICAELERNLRRSGGYGKIRLTYCNVWPDQKIGYNDLPNMTDRARVFNRALERMSQFSPDRILIACNTLSIVYGHTEYSRSTIIPALGIIGAGVDLFYESLRLDPASTIVLLGTRTTIDSGEHRSKLIRRGIEPARISAVSCHGLATAIETNPGSAEVSQIIESCAIAACNESRSGNHLFAGLCCTHYTFVAGQIFQALAKHAGRTVEILDPNHRLVAAHIPMMEKTPHGSKEHEVTVEVFSKVELTPEKRQQIANLLVSVSPVTAKALLSYTHIPDFF